MYTTRNHRVSPLKLLAPALLALIPLLALNGGQATVTQAALPTTQESTTQQEYATLVLRVYFNSIAERNRIAVELAAEEAPTTGGYLTVLGDQARIADLRARGLRVEIDQAQTAAYNAPIVFGHNPDTFYGGYYTVEEAQGFMDQKVTAYPNLVEKVDIGDSWCKTHPGACTQPNTWAGYDLFVMHITNRNIPGPKPVFWLNTGLHSREIATVEVGIRYIAYLLDNYDNNADARWLVDHHDIWVMPMVNPDGRHMAENGSSTPRSQRKNADRDDGCTNWPPPGIGTDLNRNFPFLWNCCGGSSGNPCSDVYRGPSEGSEEETQAVVNKLRQLIPDQRGPNPTDPAPLTATGNYIDMHAYGNTNLYLWGWTNAQTPNHVDLRNISDHMSATNAGGNNYQSCQSAPCYYITDGASDDWEYGELGAPAYTVEIGTTFFPQYTCVENPCGGSPGLWPENMGMLLYMAKIARTPYLTNRGPDANTVATSPMTVTQGVSSQLSATINYNWTGNAYLQNVSAAEYYIDTPPWAGGTPIAMTPTDGSFNSLTEGAQATIDTSSIPVGRHIILVRGRGVNDYGGFGSWGPISAAWLTVTSAGGTPTVTPVTTPIVPTATRTSTVAATATRTATSVVMPSATACGPSANYVFATATAVIVPGTVDTGNHCDDCTTLVPLPFPYTLYDQTSSSVYVSSNGMVHLINASSVFPFTCLPAPGPTYTIFAFTDDQDTSPAGKGVYTSVSGTTPNRIFNIEFRTCLFIGCGSGNESNYEVRLYEGQSRFDIVYGVLASNGSSAVTGVQKDAIRYTQYSCNTALAGGLLVAYTLPPCGTTTPTAVQPTATSISTVTRTNTAVPPISTSTNTAVVTVAISATVSATSTTGAPTSTGTTGIASATSTAQPPTAVATSTPCPITFTDVDTDNPFYVFIRCLACRGIISGYSDGTFRPNNDISRGQIAKMVSNSAGFSEDPGTQIYEDVPPASPFYSWINRLSMRGHMGGYNCGLVPEEPCGLENRPYFRPSASATRGQLAKIVANAAELGGTPTGIFYTDVQEDNPFYVWIMRLTTLNVMSGYTCGGPNEPCDESNRPYFRPFATVTRGQASKIVANTFFPGCQTPVHLSP